MQTIFIMLLGGGVVLLRDTRFMYTPGCINYLPNQALAHYPSLLYEYDRQPININDLMALNINDLMALRI